MNEFVTDDEQVERIKKWWSDNGSSVIAGLVIGVGGLLGWRYWVDYRANVAAEASAHFSGMISALEKSNHERATEQALIIVDDYSSTTYADLARLSLARIFSEAIEYGKAEQQLNLLLDAKPDTSIEMIARRRLSVILLQQGKMKDALNVLEVDFPQQFAAAFEELKGDILAAQGEASLARDAYQRARQARPAVANPQFLQQKMDDLGLSGVNS